ncbi:MAG: 3D domain-containing protein [Oscillospiraceae bacterium]|nr:3D domain-containing protein [Oscillospiraceae bacterium]
MSRQVNNLYTVIILVNVLAVAILGIIGGISRKQRDAAIAEAADLRAQLAEANETKVVVVEPPADMTAVNEAYTPAVEPPKQTVTVNGQECERVTADELLGMTSLGSFSVTHYCPCVQCCGKSDGVTASGRNVVPYYSVAVDPSVIPLGSIIYLDYGDGVLHECRADDTGGAVRGYKLDLCVGDHQTAVQYGVRTATVYVGGQRDEPNR